MLRPRWILPLLLLAASALAEDDTPPLAPVIIEPTAPGQVIHFADVHMATAPFSDPDPGDTHLCSDWAIVDVGLATTVWNADCEMAMGVLAVHIHLGDGEFEGPLDGRHELAPDTDYLLRVRHRDAAGTPSPFSEIAFHTSPATVVSPLVLDDVRDDPLPRWTDETGEDIALPGGADPPALVLESPEGAMLLKLAGNDGGSLVLVQPPPLSGHVPVRVAALGGAAGMELPPSRLVFTAGDGVERTVWLPALGLDPGEEQLFWVSQNGSTFTAVAGATTPDFSMLARGAAVPWRAKPGYVVEVVADGLKLPVNIAFVPEPGPEPDAPFYYLTELYGSVKVVYRDGSVHDYATGLLNFDPLGQFPGSGEQGLTGIAVDPTNGDVVVSLLYRTEEDSLTPYGRVLRLTSSDGGRTMSMPGVTVLLDTFPEPLGPSHQISNLTFGPDGKLYVHVGEGFNPAAAQDLNMYRGKILRLNPDGTAPADNPFYVQGMMGAQNFVFARGFRNPFGGVWRAADGKHYEVENGPSVDRFARVDRGENYGWSTGSNEEMQTRAIYNWDPSPAPVAIAWVQPETFGGSGFPASTMDHAFVTLSGSTFAQGPSFNAKRIVEMVVDEDGVLTAGPDPFVVYDGVGRQTAGGLAAGPDGLYFTTIYKDDPVLPIDVGAQVLRVRFAGSADFTVTPALGAAPLLCQFTDTSTVPSPTAWLWDFGDGTTSSEQNPAHTYSERGRYDVKLRVSGPGGVSVIRKTAAVRVATTRTDLVRSLAPSHAQPTLLDGERVHGPLYAFVDPEADIVTVAFFVDGLPQRIEGVAPFDLAGTDATGAGMPFDTTLLAEGPHLVRAVVTYSDTSMEEVLATIEVDNEPCGSGVTSAGEECDDGNLVDGDCCSSTCTREAAGPCDDGDGCTLGDTCTDGACIGTPLDCTGLDGTCVAGACDPAAGECVAMPRDNGADCDDGDPCTSDDTCNAGLCAGTPLACDDGDACTSGDHCVDGTCVRTPVVCAGATPCQAAAVCDPATGTCVSGTAVDCDDGAVCTTDRCDPAAGCVHDPVADCCHTDTDCDDDDPCNGTAACQPATGLCATRPAPDCDDGTPCTDDVCTPGVGCENRRLGPAVVGASAAGVAPPSCPDEEVPPGVMKLLRQAQHAIRRATEVLPKRGRRLLLRADHQLESAVRRADRRLSPTCAAIVREAAEELEAHAACFGVGGALPPRKPQR